MAEIDSFFKMAQHLWLDMQQGLLPDFGGWNYFLMALLIMIQGRSSALIGGIAAAAGALNLGWLILVAVLARLVVDLFWWRLGMTGLMDKLGRFAAPYRRHSVKLNESIQRRPTRVILMSKTLGGFSAPMTMAVGNAHVPMRRWLPASILGELLWILPLLLVGFFATDALSNVKGSLVYITAASLLLMLLFTGAKKAAARLKLTVATSK